MVFHYYINSYYFDDNKNENMKYNEWAAFVVGCLLCIIGAVLFAWSDYTTDGELGRKLEAGGYILFIPGVLSLISMFVFGKKTNNNG